MARSAGIRNVNNFSKGFVTEVHGLNFPENTAKDLSNVDINLKGEVQRRLGIDYEAGYALSSSISVAQFRDKAVSEHRWSSVGEDSSLNFQVFQIGETLYFHDLDGAEVGLSTNSKSFTVDLNTFIKPSASTVGSKRIDTAVGKGDLYVTSDEIEPFRIEYDASSDTISTTQLTIEVRDVRGLDDSLDVDERPSTLTAAHRYNLLNQGWDETKYNAYHTAKSKYPSNADIWYVAKDSDENFDPDLIDKTDFGSSASAKGRYIINYFTQNRSTVSGVGGLTDLSKSGRAEAVAFYSGRLFWATNNTVLVSQLMLDKDQAGRCYQDADPSSEVISDLIDTDGIEIPIPDAAGIVGLAALSNVVLVLAKNGIWALSGIDGKFSATGFQIMKVTSIGIQSSNAFDIIEDSLVYVSEGGIYRLVADQVSGRLSPVNITEPTIQSFFLDISVDARNNMDISYDPASKKIYFLYNGSSGFDGTQFKQRYTNFLIYDLRLGAFTKYSIGDAGTGGNAPHIYASFVSSKVRTTTTSSSVIDSSGDTVVDSSSNPVIIDDATTLSSATALQLLTIETNTGQYTISEFNNTSFYDWATNDPTTTGKGIDAAAYIESFDDIMGDLARTKRASSIYVFFNRTETAWIQDPDDISAVTFDKPSGCLLTAKWDWTDTSTAGRHTAQQQVYRFRRAFVPGNVGDTFDYSFTIIETCTKIRGKGKSLLLRFDSEAGKDFQLLGWAMPITANVNP